MRRLMIFVVFVLVGFVCANIIGPALPTQAGVLDDGYVMAGGGAFGTVEQAKTGDVKGFFGIGAVVPLYWNSKILARGSFSDLNNGFEVENYAGTVMFMSRTIDSKLINPYAFGALTFTHNSEPDSTYPESAAYGLDGGIGMMWELFGGQWYGELGYKNILGEDSFCIGLGLVFDLSKPAEEPAEGP